MLKHLKLVPYKFDHPTPMGEKNKIQTAMYLSCANYRIFKTHAQQCGRVFSFLLLFYFSDNTVFVPPPTTMIIIIIQFIIIVRGIECPSDSPSHRRDRRHRARYTYLRSLYDGPRRTFGWPDCGGSTPLKSTSVIPPRARRRPR